MSHPTGWQELDDGTWLPPPTALPQNWYDVPENVRRSVIKDGALYIYDASGTLRMIIGKSGTDYGISIFDATGSDVAQGYLGIGTVPNGGQGLTASYANVSGASVTFTVGTGRRVKVTAYVSIINLDAVNRSSFIQILDENNTVVRGDSVDHGPSGSKDAGKQYNSITFTQPSAGTHTYRLQALINGGAGTLTSNVPASAGGGSSFLSVEDVGSV